MDPDAFLRQYALDALLIWRAGELDPGGRVRPESGFTLAIADVARPARLLPEIRLWIAQEQAAMRALQPCMIGHPLRRQTMDFNVDLSVSVLARTPATLRTLLDGLAEPWVRGTEGPDTFSPFDVVGHLIDGEETDWLPRARIIMARGPDPRFERYDRFRHRARNADRSLTSLLDELERLRAANLDVLRSWRLSDVELALEGVHPAFGPVTLRQLLSGWVVHDLEHVAQVVRVMAKQYRTAVGPWVPVLPVLTDHETPRS